MSNWARLQAKFSTAEEERANKRAAALALAAASPAGADAAASLPNGRTAKGAPAAAVAREAASGKKRKRRDLSEAAAEAERARQEAKGKEDRLRSVESDADDVTVVEKALYVGLDCEMVGVGDGGKRSALARVTLVDFDGRVIYDEHVRPRERVTDFRTWVSGVKAKHLKAALELKDCIQQVAELVKGKIIVGHALKNDLQVLMLQHPVAMIRDTARYRAYMRPHGREGGKLRPRKLKDLAEECLGMDIQGGKHDSGEDARAAMLLYRAQRVEWEKEIRKTHLHKYTTAAAKKKQKRKVGVQVA